MYNDLYNAVGDQRKWLFGKFVPITFQDSVCQSAWTLAVAFRCLIYLKLQQNWA